MSSTFTDSKGHVWTNDGTMCRSDHGEAVAVAPAMTNEYILSIIEPPLSARRAAVWEQIKTLRDTLSDTGGYKVSGKWFHSDAKSKNQQLALFIMGASVPAVQWKTMDGSFVTMSQTLAGAIFQAAAQQDMAIFAAAETHRAAVEASAAPELYDFSGGWPATFGG